MAKITLKQDFLKDLQKLIEPTLWDLQDRIEDNEYIPFQTGELQESADVIKIRKGYALEYDVPYAKDVYEQHPEYIMKKDGTYDSYFHRKYSDKNYHHHGKTHKDYNENAMPDWFRPYLTHPNIVADMYAKVIKNNSKYVS